MSPPADALTVGSLFSGIGGLDLGLERAGMRVVWQSEIEPYACRVLAKHWPDVPNLGDIRDIDWSHVERTDLVCGGYPCQPFSYAGKRNGEDDPRHLWPYFRRALRDLRPRYALLENVPGHLSMGFGRVLADLAQLGYDTEWDCVPAAAVGAPHLRYRVFVVAHADQHEHEGDAPALRRQATEVVPVAHADGEGESGEPVDALTRSRLVVPDTDDAGRSEQRRAVAVRPESTAAQRGGWWAVEPDVGRVAHGIPARVDRLRTLGNAVVPQVAEWIGRRIAEVNRP